MSRQIVFILLLILQVSKFHIIRAKTSTFCDCCGFWSNCECSEGECANYCGGGSKIAYHYCSEPSWFSWFGGGDVEYTCECEEPEPEVIYVQPEPVEYDYPTYDYPDPEPDVINVPAAADYGSYEGSESSSTNVGAIVGGVVGGVVGLMLIVVVAIAIYRRKPENSKEVTSTDTVANGHAPNGNSANKAAPTVDFDPYITWLKSVEKSVGPVKLTHSKEFSFADVSVTKPIGEGSFGKVYEATYCGKTVALKIFQGDQMTPNGDPVEAMKRTGNKILEKMEKEVQLMSSLDHPNVVSLIGFCRVPACIMTELCSQGNLAQNLSTCKEKNIPLEWKTRIKYAHGIALGLQYLHSKNILHRDLKSPNVLIDANGVKLTDFNLSKYMDATMQSSSVAAMNPRWLAPELLDGVPASAESDIFSLGVVLWEILTLGVPWEGANPWVIVEKIRKGERLAYSYDPSVCSKAAFDEYESLMNKCWSSEPSKRPTASDAAISLAAML